MCVWGAGGGECEAFRSVVLSLEGLSETPEELVRPLIPIQEFLTW